MDNIPDSVFAEYANPASEKHQELVDTMESRQQRIDDLERWCGHLQGLLDAEVAQREEREQQYEKLEKKLGIFFKIARKIKRWLTRT